MSNFDHYSYKTVNLMWSNYLNYVKNLDKHDKDGFIDPDHGGFRFDLGGK